MAGRGLSRDGRASACVKVLLGTLGILVGAVALMYTGLFYSGVWEVVSIDGPSVWHHPGLLHPWPVVNNSLLLLIFSVTHSLLARKWMKETFSYFSPSAYRHIYMFLVSLSLFLICYGWSPLPTPVLWDIQSTSLRLIIWGVCGFGALINIMAFFSHSVVDFIAISEALERLTRVKRKRGDLITTGLYGFVRHPMYTSLLTCFWSHPTMTLSRFMLVSGLTLYVLVSVPLFEEPDLTEVFGERYREYKRTTPMLLPVKLGRSNRDQEKSN